MNEIMPLVCVVMPVYNGASTIELALKSLLMQTYKKWICIIVNDGSSDSTKYILDKLTDPRFRIYHLSQNRGRGYARQYALERVEGDYLTYLDADDFYHQDKLQMQVDILEKDSDIALVACAGFTFDDNYLPLTIRGGEKIDKLKYKIRDKLKIFPVTSMIRLKEAKNISYSNLNAGEDVDYFSRYLDGKYYANLDKVLLYYYVGSTTYKKILQYFYNEIKRGFYTIRRDQKMGLSILISSLLKFFIYLFFVPILGVKFFLKRRGKSISEKDILEFNAYKNHLDKEKRLIM